MHAFIRHGIVERSADSTPGLEALEVDEADKGRFFAESDRVGLIVADAEDDIHTGAVLAVDVVNIVSTAGVDVVVQELGALVSLGRLDVDASLFDHVLEVKSGHVDREARRCVVECALRF